MSAAVECVSYSFSCYAGRAAAPPCCSHYQPLHHCLPPTLPAGRKLEGQQVQGAHHPVCQLYPTELGPERQLFQWQPAHTRVQHTMLLLLPSLALTQLYCRHRCLQAVSLRDNRFEGPITQLANCTLQSLDLSDNMFTGSLPTPVSSTPWARPPWLRLMSISCSNNNLTGSLPEFPYGSVRIGVPHSRGRGG